MPDNADGKCITFQGRVCGVEIKEGKTYLYLNHLQFPDNREISRKYRIKVSIYEPCGVSCGNILSVTGEVVEAKHAGNAGQFDNYEWQRLQNILFTVKNARIRIVDSRCDRLRQTMFLLREECKNRFASVLPEAEAAVMSAMLLGDKGELDEQTKSWYQAGGISHVLAISGLHISMLGMALYRLLRRLGMPFVPCALTSGVLMGFYAAFTGAGVATCRAVIMFLVFLGAQCLGRTYDLLCALSLAVILILLDQPLWLFAAGFQLSVLAVAAIAIVHPILQREYGRKVSAGISIQLVMFPCVLWHYYAFSVCGIVLNLLVIPLLPFVLALGLFILGASLVSVHAMCFAATGVRCILGFYEILCRIFLKLPFSRIVLGRPDVWEVAVFYGTLLFGLFLLMKNGTGKRRKMFPILLLAGFSVFFPNTSEDLQLSFLDVGQGDCMFIRCGGDINILCDGGSSSVKNVGKYRILPFLQYHGVAELDYVFLTHMDADHINGVKELMEMELGSVSVDTLVLPDISNPDDAYRKMERTAKDKGIKLRYMSAGDRICFGNLAFTCLHPAEDFLSDDKNQTSLALHVSYKSFDAILTGDLEKEGEAFLVQSKRLETLRSLDGEIEFLKAGHHGSANATSDALLAQLKPRAVVLSYGDGNRYGHPAPEVLKRLENAGCFCMATAKFGEISVFYDKKEKITVRYGRNVIK